jgi:hypothetical protein
MSSQAELLEDVADVAFDTVLTEGEHQLTYQDKFWLGTAAHTIVCPEAVSASPAPTRSPFYYFPNRRQGIDPQQYLPLSKQLITHCRSCHCPHLNNVSVSCQVWLLHTLPLSLFSGIVPEPNGDLFALLAR